MSSPTTCQDELFLTETIDGQEVNIRRCPSLAHNVAAGNILCQFAAYLRGKDGKCFHGLAVEVLSPSTAANDRGIKKDTYEKVGVREYWIVDPVSKAIEVYHLQNGRLTLDRICMVFPPEEWERMTEEQRAAARLTVKVSLYDDLLVDAREVFEDLE